MTLGREIPGLFWVPLPQLSGPVPLSGSIVAQLIRCARASGWNAEEIGTFRFPHVAR